MPHTDGLIAAATTLKRATGKLGFAAPITHVCNPLDYAWASHKTYLERFGAGRKRVVLMGMNPGPWGMAQTGVPFGEIAAVRDWMGIEASVKQPKDMHPKRPIEGFACQRSEVSGRRLWGLFSERFCEPEAFFADHFVANYCPLVFMEESGKNFTPDKLPALEREPLEAACDAHLARVIEATQPEWLIGVGAFAEKCGKRVVKAMDANGELKIGKILHPSPASPAANRGWAEQATKQLEAMGVW